MSPRSALVRRCYTRPPARRAPGARARQPLAAGVAAAAGPLGMARDHGYDRAMEHRFTGPAYTLGIEEELMILDAETLDLSNSIEAILRALPPVEGEPQVKEELMESVVEVMTTPAGSV